MLTDGGLMLLFVALAACSNSGLDKPTPTGTGDTAAVVTTQQDCPWVGTWALSSVNCNTFPFATWYDTHTSATLQIDHAPAGGCAVVATVVGAACTRTESWHFSVPVGTSVEVTFEGIASCDPDQCAFGADEPTCSVGGMVAGPLSLTIDDSAGDLAAIGLLEDTAPSCNLDVVTRWNLQ